MRFIKDRIMVNKLEKIADRMNIWLEDKKHFRIAVCIIVGICLTILTIAIVAQWRSQK